MTAGVPADGRLPGAARRTTEWARPRAARPAESAAGWVAGGSHHGAPPHRSGVARPAADAGRYSARSWAGRRSSSAAGPPRHTPSPARADRPCRPPRPPASGRLGKPGHANCALSLAQPGSAISEDTATSSQNHPARLTARPPLFWALRSEGRRATRRGRPGGPGGGVRRARSRKGSLSPRTSAP